MFEVAFILVFFPSILYDLAIVLWLTDKSPSFNIYQAKYLCQALQYTRHYSGLAKVTWFVTAKLLIFYLLSIHTYFYTCLDIHTYNIHIRYVQLHVHICIYMHSYLFFMHRYSLTSISCIYWTQFDIFSLNFVIDVFDITWTTTIQKHFTA